jgi:Xaa-Pro aminopeptidase
MTFDYSGRLEHLQGRMRDRGVDVVLLSVGADLLYLTGYEAMPSERITALVLRSDGDPVLFVPDLEAPRVTARDFEVVSWGETDDPVDRATQVVDSPGLVAVGDQMWSSFLINFQKRWTGADWMSASELTSELRMRKDRIEIEALRRAARGIDLIMGRIPEEIRFAGRSESEIARDLAAMTLDVGHDSAEFTIVASGPNGASPHHEPGDRVIEDGDLVVCDFGGRWDGYYSDSTRTFTVGEPSVGQVEVYDLVLEANEAGRAAVESGAPCQEIDRAARKVIEDAGYGDRFIHRTGHGIGLEVHEHPYIVEGNEMPVEVGMTFSIEPGIYLPDRFGIRIEDIVACDDDGADTLNNSSRAISAVS